MCVYNYKASVTRYRMIVGATSNFVFQSGFSTSKLWWNNKVKRKLQIQKLSRAWKIGPENVLNWCHSDANPVSCNRGQSVNKRYKRRLHASIPPVNNDVSLGFLRQRNSSSVDTFSGTTAVNLNPNKISREQLIQEGVTSRASFEVFLVL
jgi:hypothetical protein